MPKERNPMYLYVSLGLVLIYFFDLPKAIRILTRIGTVPSWLVANIPLPSRLLLNNISQTSKIHSEDTQAIIRAKIIPLKFSEGEKDKSGGGGGSRKYNISSSSRGKNARYQPPVPLPSKIYQIDEASMHITTTNFAQQKPKILEQLRSSVFVSFDLEFSGIGGARDGRRPPPRVKQTTQECYISYKERVEKYQVLQLGMCPVEWDEKESKWTNIWHGIDQC